MSVISSRFWKPQKVLRKCENRPEKCPKWAKMFFQILKGFPICFPIYCVPKRSARLKYYRKPQDRAISDLFGQDSVLVLSKSLSPELTIWVDQIRPVWGKLICQTAQKLGRSVRILTGEPSRNWISVSGFLDFF